MSEGKEITRRDFLKKTLMAGAGFAFLKSIKEFKPIKELGKNMIEKGDISFEEIKNGDWISLQKSDELGVFNVCIRYFEVEDKLNVRITNNQEVCLDFPQPDATIRSLGEIVVPTLFLLKKSSNLADNVTVGVYPTLDGELVGMQGRKDFPGNMKIYGIPVITAPNNYFPGEGTLPTEKNAKGNMPYSEFGLGYAIGTINEEGKKIQLDIIGFVPDARALEVGNS